MSALQLNEVEVVCHYDMAAVRPEKLGEKTQGGIVLPDSARQQNASLLIGTIVAVGPGRQDEKGNRLEMPYKTGDRIVYQVNAYGGGQLEVNGEKLDLIGSPNIYCTLQPKQMNGKPQPAAKK